MPEISRIASLANENEHDHDDDYEEDEEEHHGGDGSDRIDLSENYQFARVIKLMKLKKDILEERKNKANRNGAGFSFLSLFGVGGATPIEVQQMNAVDDYWSGNNVASSPTTHVYQPNMIFDVKILQMAFRVWIELKKMRAVRKIANKNSEKTIMIQSAVRRWLTKKRFVVLEAEKLARDKAFRDFCVEMKKGVEIDMFSKKHGMALRRIIRIIDGCLVYQTSAWHYAKRPCNTIYAVNKGLSPHKYSTEFQGQRALCFHLILIGDIVLDFCARDTLQTKMLLEGFTYLRMLLFTQAPFYIDEQGFPRRANESIIDRALDIAEGRVIDDNDDGKSGGLKNYSKTIVKAFRRNKDPSDEEGRRSVEEGGGGGGSETDPLKAATLTPVKRVKGSISEADDMRLVTAKSLLATEYKAWNEAYRKEKEEWMEEMRSRHHGHGRSGSRRRKKGGAETSSASMTESQQIREEAKAHKNRRSSLTTAFKNMFGKRKKSDKGDANKNNGKNAAGAAHHRGSLSSFGSGTLTSGDDLSMSHTTTVTPPPPSSSGAANRGVTFGAANTQHPPPPPPVASVPTPGVKPVIRPTNTSAAGAASVGAPSTIAPSAVAARDVAAVHAALASSSGSPSGKPSESESEEEEDSEEDDDEDEEESSDSEGSEGSEDMSDEFDEDEDEEEDSEDEDK